jgi:hypothetical protein
MHRLPMHRSKRCGPHSRAGMCTRMAFNGISVVSAAGVIALLTAEWSLGAQLAKSNRKVLDQTREVRTYDRPRRNGNRLSFCLTTDGGCGKSAADEFCRGNDFEGALTFQRDHMDGHGAQVRFLRIKCWRSKGFTSDKEAVASEVPRTEVLSNMSTKSDRMRLGGQGEWK